MKLILLVTDRAAEPSVPGGHPTTAEVAVMSVRLFISRCRIPRDLARRTGSGSPSTRNIGWNLRRTKAVNCAIAGGIDVWRTVTCRVERAGADLWAARHDGAACQRWWCAIAALRTVANAVQPISGRASAAAGESARRACAA